VRIVGAAVAQAETLAATDILLGSTIKQGSSPRSKGERAVEVHRPRQGRSGFGHETLHDLGHRISFIAPAVCPAVSRASCGRPA
jgi:hypothetical protein